MRPHRTPTGGRFSLGASLFVLSGVPVSALAQDTEVLTEALAVRRGLARPGLSEALDEELRGRAQARIARGRRRAELAEISAEIRGLRSRTVRLAAAARRFGDEAVRSSAELVATAEAAYRGGELGILELLDAYRSAPDAELQALVLAAAARDARIELDRITTGAPR